MFDIDLARKIYAASDFMIIPSRYEPCGLVQMIAMWYGAVPVVHATGGLKDSVEEGKTGYLFNIYSSKELLKVIKRALEDYKSDKYTSIVNNCLDANFDWKSSAAEYKKLYETVIELRNDSVELSQEM
jgi:starch synthase